MTGWPRGSCYAWPDRPPYKPLQERRGGHDDGALGRLQRIVRTAGNAENPLVLKLDVGAVKLARRVLRRTPCRGRRVRRPRGRLVRQGTGLRRPPRGRAVSAWRGPRPDGAVPPATITADAVRDAAGLWAEYFWPIAHTTFAGAGKTLADRQARKIIAWIRRTGASTISVEDVRVRALGRAVDAAEATALIARLVIGGVLRLASPSRRAALVGPLSAGT